MNIMTILTLGDPLKVTRVSHLFHVKLINIHRDIPNKIGEINDNNNNGRNGSSFYVAGYLIEERHRWPVIAASPRGQCSN